MKAPNAKVIINKNFKGLFIVSKKGWTQLEARRYLVEFLTCGTSLSLSEFMASK